MASATANNRRLLLYAMLASLALAAAAGVLGVLSGGTDVIWRLVGTAFATSVGCALLLVTSRLIDKPQTRPSSVAAMLLVVVEYLLGLMLIWQDVFSSSFTASIFSTMVAVAAAGLPAIAVVRMAGEGRHEDCGDCGPGVLAIRIYDHARRRVGA